MATPPFPQFTNGVAYEEFMGRWSLLVGEDFLERPYDGRLSGPALGTMLPDRGLPGMPGS